MAALMFGRRTNSCVFHNSFQMDITNVFRTLTKATAERRKNSTKSIVSSKDKKIFSFDEDNFNIFNHCWLCCQLEMLFQVI